MICFVGAKTWNEKLFNFIQSHSQQYGDVQVIFFNILLQFKMTAIG